MKKWKAVLSACLMVTAIALPATVHAAAERQVKVYLDNKLVKFDVPPILDDGTTLVQFRPIFERLGLTVGWDAATQTVTGTNDSLKITLTIDDIDAYVNDDVRKLDLAPRLVDGNTFVPLRFVSEASGKEVKWVQSTAAIYLKSPAGSKPNVGLSGGGAKPVLGSEKGEYVFPDGSKYTGQMKNDLPEGRGKIVSAAGKPLFDGTMVSGLTWDGRQKSYYDNGQMEYDIAIKDGVFNGSGKQYSTAGKLVYDGTFVDGEREKGTLYYDNGDKYVGPFAGDQPSGTGKIVYKNGDVFEGEFIDGNREGQGVYTTTKGEKLMGPYKNNLMDGTMYLYDKKGNLLSVSEYSNNVQMSKVDMGDGTSTIPNTNPTVTDPTTYENDRHDKALKQIKERYAQNKKVLEDQITQIRKDNPGIYSTQAAYDKALQEANKKQSDIIEKMNSISRDYNSSGDAAMEELNKQLSDIQEQLTKLYALGSAQRRIAELKDQVSALTKSYNTELKNENDQHNSALKQIKQQSS
ncbi:stalk domain-containing protein [Paenibacillus thalictri]|uniref:stalk domain-containing protein n=1 Tax=Paenibacillus thalictri TaxID=2527873 RepID=UPI0013EF2891|nr:stalk domain-containing protein [Paenibacillus thalictri]